MRIALTAGEPAGIGLDLLVQLAQESRRHEWLAVTCPQSLTSRAEQLGLPLKIHELTDMGESLRTDAATLSVLPVASVQAVRAGVLEAQNAPHVIECLQRSAELCLSKQCHALVTGPVHKGHLVASGIPFYGHTEFLARVSEVKKPVMMLASKRMRIVLATTHVPLAKVAEHIDRASLTETLTITHDFLCRRLGINDPCIAVLGLNPHAGDDGALGSEEQEIIEPCLDELRKKRMKLIGPLSADSAFGRDEVKGADAILAMYHDQALPVLKYSDFGNIVNITMGLPIVRTSVDHGTALDLAGSGKADHQSMAYALEVAAQLVEAQT